MSKKTDDKSGPLGEVDELARAQAQAIVDKEIALQNQLAVEQKQPETFLDRLRREHAELGDRHAKLQEFMDGPSYPALDKEERERLAGQFVAMGHYYGILAARIAYHEAQGAK